MKMLFKNSFLYLIFILYYVTQSQSCYHRDYGKGGTVCVCNITFCDKFDSIEKTKPGQVIVIESSLKGKRFEISKVKLTNSNKIISLNDTKTITVQHNVTFQKIIGFGGAFTDAAGINIVDLPEQMSKRIIQDYYSPSGLEYSIGRIPIGGSDFSTKPYTYDDNSPGDFNLINFKLQNEDAKYKIPLIKLAKTVSSLDIKFFASPWSAPAWMKSNNKINGMGKLKGTPGGIYFKTWANYFVKFIKEYEKQGIPLWAITTQNEPIDGLLPNFTFNCLGFTAEEMRDFIKTDLGPALVNAGYPKLKVITMDDQRPFINKWANTVLKDANATKYVSGLGIHWYLDEATPPTLLDEVHRDFPDKFLLYTEACEGSGLFEPEKVLLGSWLRGENYANDIIENLRHHVSGWVDWNLALNEQGGPNWVDNFVDSPIIVNSTGKEYYKQPMYYVISHFSKLLKPDSIRIKTVEEGNDKVQTVAFVTPQNATVLIAFNKNDKDYDISVVDTKSEIKFRNNVPAHSIQSYVWY